MAQRTVAMSQTNQQFNDSLTELPKTRRSNEEKKMSLTLGKIRFQSLIY
jgi:hypothetical protein